MARDDFSLIGPDEVAFHLELTPAQLKVTHTALKSLLDDFGHDQRDVIGVIREVLDKLPDERDLPELHHELERLRAHRRPAA